VKKLTEKQLAKVEEVGNELPVTLRNFAFDAVALKEARRERLGEIKKIDKILSIIAPPKAPKVEK
jgi:hypothetical protein